MCPGIRSGSKKTFKEKRKILLKTAAGKEVRQTEKRMGLKRFELNFQVTISFKAYGNADSLNNKYITIEI